jgi:endosialidase-like protein
MVAVVGWRRIMLVKTIGASFVILITMVGLSSAQAACTVTNHFTNGTTADANQVNTNFSDLTSCAAPLASPSFTGTTTFPGSTGITNAGHLLVNTTNDYSLLTAIGNGSGSIGYLRSNSTADRFLQFISTATGSSTMAYFEVYGAPVGSIVSNNYGTNYNTTSDQRLKDWQIQQRNYAQAIRNLWVGDFRWKKGGTADFGVRAQQAYSVFPTAIHKPENDKELWQADYGKLAPLALWGVKDLYKTTDEQSREVAGLREEVKSLRAQLAMIQTEHASEMARADRLEASMAMLQRKLGLQTASK